jgi:hypothetical protein
LFLLWCLTVLFLDSEGRTKVLGLIVVPIAVLVDVYRHAARFLGDQPPAVTLLFFLLPIAWFLLESLKRDCLILPRPAPVSG